jgi:hypothetical protein
MIRVVVSAVLSSAATSIFFLAVVVPTVRQNWREQGQNEGSIAARVDIANKLRAELNGQSSACKLQHSLFAVKATAVDFVDCGSFKSVRVQE